MLTAGANVMRELTFLETGYMASLLLASLVLPILLSVLAPVGKARKTSARIVWSGQLILSAAGLTVLMSAAMAIYAALFAVIVVMMFASGLLLLRNTPVAGKA
jgi:hypothetical protein